MKRLPAAPLFALFLIVTIAALLANGQAPLSLAAVPEMIESTQPTASAPPVNVDPPADTPAMSQQASLTTVDAPEAVPGLPTATPPAVSALELQQQRVEPARSSAPSSASPSGWNPITLTIPLSRQPYDHFWFMRPVAADHVNSGLMYYPYGSTGSRKDMRIHHGIDIVNPVGVEIRAAGSGTVVWAGRGHFNRYEGITSYGNTVVIEHEFGYDGEKVYTLYAHMSAMLVDPGAHVNAGDVIGLIGATGQVSGPHVHFEVRLGRNSYYAVRNPTLWLAPYVGTGVVAGRVAFPSGDPAADLEVKLIDLQTGDLVQRTVTYAGFGVSPDDNWNENFAIPDVPTGTYLVTASFGAGRWTAEVSVREGLTNWAEMELQTVLLPTPAPDASPPPSP